MPYYVGIINDYVESLNTTLSPEEAEQRYIQFEQISAPMKNPTYDNGFRERTEAEIEAIAQTQARDNAINETKFTRVQIRDAFKALYGTAEALNNLINSDQDFKDYWSDANIIDLNHTLTSRALASLTEEQITSLKLKIAGEL